MAGAAAAAFLSRAGRQVTLVERTLGPVDKICGEFLSGEASFYLARLGVDLRPLGGHRIIGVRLVRGRASAEAMLPFSALGLSRRALDDALLRHAAAMGAEVRRGQVVVGADGTTLRLTGGTTICARALFLATGKHDLRGLRRQTTAEAHDLVGFKTHLRLSRRQHAALAGWIELILFPDAYAGLQRIEQDRANLCLLVSRARLERVGGSWSALLAELRRDNAHLQARLDGAEDLFAQPLAIAGVPYGFVHRPHKDDPPGIYRLGDQAAVIPSFCGDGMAIALHSAALATRMAITGQGAAAYHVQLWSDVASQVRGAWRLQKLGQLGAGQAALMGAAMLWPGSLRCLAAYTRVPAAAVAEALA